MDAKTLVKILCCFAIIIVFWVLPPLDPITQIGMRTIGVFIGTVLLLSVVDTVWPAIFAFAILSQTGVMNLNTILAGSLGSWITTFVIMSFVLTHALNEVGFTSRLTAYYKPQICEQESVGFHLCVYGIRSDSFHVHGPGSRYRVFLRILKQDY
jgi:hypothetical protein